jgi:Uma2 family endonuclease
MSLTNRPPPLESGDSLTRREFERRCEATKNVGKVELIEGVIFFSAPIAFDSHAEQHSRVTGWLGVYRAATPGVRCGDNATLRLDEDNEPQPDVTLIIDPAHGVRSRVSADGYLEGSPELIVEIAASSASNDLRDKFKAYRRNGVQEYAVWQVYDGRFDWWELRDGDYVPLPRDEAGIMRSHVFPGLWLNVPALLAGNLAAVLSTLQLGLQSPEHAAFVNRLQTTA